MILAGDIGGTNTRLAVFESKSGMLSPLLERDYASHDHRGLGEMASAFLSNERLRPDSACFGVAGPVLRGRVSAPNLAWVVDAAELSETLGISEVWLINDLEAHAYGVTALEEKDFVDLNPNGVSASGNAALIAAGTGLGEAGLFWDGKRLLPFASEGGHGDFAPNDELQIELLRYLTAKFGRVSVERVLSGPGLRNIYEFLRDTKKEEEPAWLHDELAAVADPSPVISRHGADGKAAICERAVEIMVEIYGSEAGNLALKMMSLGGVYVGGGIAPKILPKLKEPWFLKAFLNKGRLSPVLAQMKVRVVLNDRSGLIGAARCAQLHLQAAAKVSA